MNILVADDDRVLTHMLATQLGKRGFRVSVAYDAMQAIMMGMRFQFAAVVLDLGMPGGSGLEVLRRLKSSTKCSLVPVVVLSGSSDEEKLAQARELGAEEVLPKPPDIDLLESLLRRLGPPQVHISAGGFRRRA